LNEHWPNFCEQSPKRCCIFRGDRRLAVQQLTKKYLKALGLYESEKSVHALRHSYAVEFYRQEKDLRALQKQLGHSSVQTTQIYADVTIQDIQAQIKGLWG
jgi:integrase/recombinase XerD